MGEIDPGVPVIQQRASRACREMRRSARGGDPWARRARRCAAAVKGEVMVEVSDGQGQAARACEEKGFKAKTWVIEGLSGAQALLLALHHLSRRARLSAVIKSWTSPCQRGGEVSRFLAFPAAPLCALRIEACTRIKSEAQECGGNPRPDVVMGAHSGLVKTFLPFPTSKRYTSPSSLSTNSS